MIQIQIEICLEFLNILNHNVEWIYYELIDVLDLDSANVRAAISKIEI